MSLDALKGLFGPKPIIEDFSAVRPGRARLGGTVKAGPETLKSPVGGVRCVAFFYRAFYTVQGRTGMAERTLKRAEVYTPEFVLEMKGGTVRVVPKQKAGSFSAEEHREVASQGFSRFKAEEQVVRPGDRIAVRGRVSEDAEGWCIRPGQIEILETERPKRSAHRPGPKTRRKSKPRAKAKRR